MAFCGYCGAQMPDDMSFCTECGKPLLKKSTKPVNSNADDASNDENHSIVMGDPKDNPIDGADVSIQSNIDISDASIWTTTHLDDQNGNTSDLYQSLKNTKAQKEKEEKKGFILPLILTLVFAGIAIAVVIIKYKPYERWMNASAGTISEAEPAPTDNTEETPSTSPAQPETVKPVNETHKEPEIKDMQACFRPINPYFDYVYIDYYFEVYNPNSSTMILSLQLTWNLRDASNAILGTDTAQANLIMPGETVYVFGTIQLTKSEAALIASDDTQYEWDYATESRFYSPIRYSDIVVSNVSVRGTGYDAKVTGEISNNSEFDTSAFTEVYAIFWKGDDMVAIESTFIDPIYSGSSRVFEVSGFHDIPDYDSVKIFVDVW